MTRCHRINTESGSESGTKILFCHRYHLIMTLGVGNMDQKLLELLKTLKFRKSLIPRPQKSPKIAQRRDRSIAICSNFCIGMVFSFLNIQRSNGGGGITMFKTYVVHFV